MFLKRKVAIDPYCETRLGFLFSNEQTERLLAFKRTCPDPRIIAADETLYQAHMRAGSIELLSMAVVKKYHNIDMSIQMSQFIERYLEKHDASHVKLLLDMYSKALAHPMDGVGEMAALMVISLCQSRSLDQTIGYFRDFLYVGLQSIREDFKQIKVIPN